MAIAGVAVALLTRAFTPSWMADEIYLLIVALAAWVFGELAVRALFHLFARWRARGQMIGETVAVTIKDDALVVHRDGQALEIDWRKITAVLQCSGAIFLCRYEAEPIQIPRRAFAHAQVSRDIVGWVEKRADIEEWGL